MYIYYTVNNKKYFHSFEHPPHPKISISQNFLLCFYITGSISLDKAFFLSFKPSISDNGLE